MVVWWAYSDNFFLQIFFLFCHVRTDYADTLVFWNWAERYTHCTTFVRIDDVTKMIFYFHSEIKVHRILFYMNNATHTHTYTSHSCLNFSLLIHGKVADAAGAIYIFICLRLLYRFVFGYERRIWDACSMLKPVTYCEVFEWIRYYIFFCW